MNQGGVAAHLCGPIAREVATLGRFSSDGLVRTALEAFLLARVFNRVQVNARSDQYRMNALAMFCAINRVQVVAQARGPAFPADDVVSWLHDESGGRGSTPAYYPTADESAFVGYAGGINPDNVLSVIEKVSEVCRGAYWIDMESGVREGGDRFDIAACRSVCEAVYPEKR